ncbi:integration host factor subunit beta [Desulfuromonas acetoxidans]|uniref:Histone-like DNA-binding protein n=1 Tax=Desulfuromonas acetoxidans (strain DSM 684 / 11070) TaxID=281689 RepID=Q1K0U6_DESA6|nr:integration host factor subunit beta [Desulfuromonas acetoxidans]EAT16262.1 histone-like DNA-binding protein [Desulfuromonas acetoxidans DSM 684]MBF0645099.1 integration host factor subunit beta [Desulfuromonas acetoxidans]NVD23092.1 integration host factor subunit beta [Desulfuromonas acetoxidans]NVE15667.1 integration host factor subunit beta [Desulfuromonas acetoxidans]
MTKSQLIERLMESTSDLNKKESELVVNTIFDSIGSALIGGDRVEIRGFGSFSIREREARQARNPKSGNLINIPSKKTPFFKTGKELRERVDSLG